APSAAMSSSPCCALPPSSASAPKAPKPPTRGPACASCPRTSPTPPSPIAEAASTESRTDEDSRPPRQGRRSAADARVPRHGSKPRPSRLIPYATVRFSTEEEPPRRWTHGHERVSWGVAFGPPDAGSLKPRAPNSAASSGLPPRGALGPVSGSYHPGTMHIRPARPGPGQEERMRLKRVPQDSVFYERLSDLVSQMRQCNLVLAELSGIEVSRRREVADRLREIGDRADEDMGAMLRALREN